MEQARVVQAVQDRVAVDQVQNHQDHPSCPKQNPSYSPNLLTLCRSRFRATIASGNRGSKKKDFKS